MNRTLFFVVLALGVAMDAAAKNGGKTAALAATATAATAATISSPPPQGGSGRAGGFSTTGMRPFVDPRHAPPVDPQRTVNEVDCTKPVDFSAGNLKCK